MGKRKKKLKVCKGCKTLTKRLSRKGYCEDCSMQRAVNSVVQLQIKEGEIYEKWRENLAKSLQKSEAELDIKDMKEGRRRK